MIRDRDSNFMYCHAQSYKVNFKNFDIQFYILDQSCIYLNLDRLCRSFQLIHYLFLLPFPLLHFNMNVHLMMKAWHPMTYSSEFKALMKMIVENKLYFKEKIGNPMFPCLKTIRRARMTTNLGLNLPCVKTRQHS